MSTCLRHVGCVCRSRHQLEYRQAQDILEGKDTPASRLIAPGDRSEIVSRLEVLHQLAAKRRSARIKVMYESSVVGADTNDKAPTVCG